MKGTKRLLVLLLCLSLVLGMMPSAAFATDTEVDSTPAESEPEHEADPVLPQSEDPSQAPEDDTSELLTETPEQDSGEPAAEESAEPDTEAPIELPVDETVPEGEEEPGIEPSFSIEPASEEPLTEEPTETPTTQPETKPVTFTRLRFQTRKLTLSYDDRISVESIEKGYSILSVETNRVDSKQVANGRVTTKKDKAVLTYNAGSDQLIASGTGIATVYLVPTGYLADARKAVSNGLNLSTGQGPERPAASVVKDIPCIRCRITVTPAKLTLFFLAGQSNMEGICNGGYRRADSVACTPGTVYSTYIPAAARPDLVTGTSVAAMTVSSNWSKSVSAYLPASMTASVSMNGKNLVYPLNALTADGKGKTGMDSALGYEWNRLTGEKVWLINAGWTGTSISQWIAGGICASRADAAFTGAIQVLQAEVSAGHYTSGRRILFWMQGERDRQMDATKYGNNLRSVLKYYQKKCGTQYSAMISVRAANAAAGHMGTGDLALTGPRIAQYEIAANQSDSRIYMVSNANENWVSDQGVKQWFAAAYPGGKLDYPMHAGGRSTLPTLETQIHPAIHYTQIGHNENGFTAARGLYDVLIRKTAAKSVSWLSSGGKLGKNLVQAGAQGTAVLEVSPVTASKQVSWKTGGGLSYTPSTGEVRMKSSGIGTVQCSSGGKSLNQVTVTRCAAPSGIQTQNVNTGIQVSWGAVRNAENYRVFYRIGTDAWQKAGDTKKTSLVMKKLTGGKKYTFTVRCLNAAGTAYTSGYNTTGVSITYVTPPVLRGAQTGKGSAKVLWNRSEGAVKYRVYYKKTWESNWKAAGTTDKTEFTLNNLAKGNYLFTVRCISADGKAYSSGYDTKGKAFAIKKT